MSVSSISKELSGTGYRPPPYNPGIVASNGLYLLRELGHIRLGVARHDGHFFVSNNESSNAGTPPMSLTHHNMEYKLIEHHTKEGPIDITAKGDDTPDHIANDIKYKENITSFILAADIESNIISTLPKNGNDQGVNVHYTRPGRSNDDTTFKISINKPIDTDPLIKEEISQYWECAEMVIFNKELDMTAIKKIRSYLYYKYFNETELSNPVPKGPNGGEHAQLYSKSDANFLVYDPRLQASEPLHFSEGALEGERGKSVLFEKNSDPENTGGVLKFEANELATGTLYSDKNIIKTSTVYKKASNIDNNYLYSLDDDGNIHVCNPAA